MQLNLMRSWKLRWFATALVAAALIPATIPSALAVNNTGAFELDGNAVSSTVTPGPPDDWDRVCHEVLGTDCSTTFNTNGSNAVEFVSQGAATGTTFTG